MIYMRSKFDEQLENLNKEMICMGKLCEQAIATAIKVTMDYANETLRIEVFDIDAEIDRKEREIENICMKLLLRQQPVAKYLERIGDHATNIAGWVEYSILGTHV